MNKYRYNSKLLRKVFSEEELKPIKGLDVEKEYLKVIDGESTLSSMQRQLIKLVHNYNYNKTKENKKNDKV